MSKDVIIVIRHGKPALSRNILLTWRGYREWWGRYDESGLAEGQMPPENVEKLAQNADMIISSSLPRALETARACAGREPDMITDELIEAALPSPPLGPIRLEPRGWGTISRIIWILGYSSGQETHMEANRRRDRAADILVEKASGGKTVFVAAHGWFNYMLKGALKRRGFRCVENHGSRYWAYRRYEKENKL